MNELLVLQVIVGAATAVAAGGAAIIALRLGKQSLEMGERSLRQNINIQKRQHRLRLLDEIIEWDMEVPKVHLEVRVEDMQEHASAGDLARIWLGSVKGKYLAISLTGLYIQHIAPRFGDGMMTRVGRVNVLLSEMVKFLDRFLNSTDINKAVKDNLEELGKRNDELLGSVLALMGNATEAKLEDIELREIG